MLLKLSMIVASCFASGVYLGINLNPADGRSSVQQRLSSCLSSLSELSSSLVELRIDQSENTASQFYSDQTNTPDEHHHLKADSTKLARAHRSATQILQTLDELVGSNAGFTAIEQQLSELTKLDTQLALQLLESESNDAYLLSHLRS